MIKAFAEVVKSHPEQKLKIYGAGQQRKELENLITHLGLSSSVSLEGQTHDVPSVLSGAIGFLMTSDYEGMPNALMEAMAMGLPCIATDCPCGGPAELIVDGENGFLIATGDEAALSGRMNSIVENHSLRESVGAEAANGMGRFLPEEAFARWEAYFNRIYGGDA